MRTLWLKAASYNPLNIRRVFGNVIVDFRKTRQWCDGCPLTGSKGWSRDGLYVAESRGPEAAACGWSETYRLPTKAVEPMLFVDDGTKPKELPFP